MSRLRLSEGGVAYDFEGLAAKSMAIHASFSWERPLLAPGTRRNWLLSRPPQMNEQALPGVHAQRYNPRLIRCGRFGGNRLLTNLKSGRRKFDVEKTIAEEVVYHQGAWAVESF